MPKKPEFHGLTKHPLYPVWNTMRQRCINPRSKAFYKYGARGITVCDRWRDSFAAFLHDMGERPEGCSIERIDNSGPYSPENCKWADRRQQASNKRNNIKITHEGKTLCLTAWAEEFGIPLTTIYRRVFHMGLPFHVAILDRDFRAGRKCRRP